MANDEQIKVIITAEDKASGVLSDLGQKAGGLSSIMSAGLGLAVAGVTAAFGALVAVAYKSIEAFDESQHIMAQLDAVLASTKGVAGVTKDAVVELGKALQKTTTFSDEQVKSVENLLLTFTKIGKDIFPDATKAVLDMATALKEDTGTAAIQLGKALQDPILGVTALRRVGVDFSKDQVDLIKHLVETGQSLQAQKFILGELTTEFGGSAAAAATTFGGKMLQLKNAVNDLEEQIGGALITAITPFITQLTEFAQRPETQAQIQGIANQIANMATKLAPLVSALIPALIQGINIAIGVVTFLGKAFMVVTDAMGEWFFQIMQIWDFLQKFIDRINAVTDALIKMAKQAFGGGGLDFTNKIGDSISSFLGIGGKASGGPVSGGTPYIVGESGPELFIPGGSGSILPNGAGLGGVTVNIMGGTYLSQDAAMTLADMMIGRLKQELRI